VTQDKVATAAKAEKDDLPQEVRLIAKSLEYKNHYEVFGIKQGEFSINLLKERYFAMTRKFGPEVLMQLGGEEAVLVEEILSKVATAYDTLTDVVKKERYDEMLGADKIGLGHKGDDRFQAQVQAESGKVFLEMEEWDNAERALQEAVNADPDNGEYLASLAWTIYRSPKYTDSLPCAIKPSRCSTSRSAWNAPLWRLLTKAGCFSRQDRNRWQNPSSTKPSN
jgi:tetratricopeptide (TPR) repeat protein